MSPALLAPTTPDMLLNQSEKSQRWGGHHSLEVLSSTFPLWAWYDVAQRWGGKSGVEGLEKVQVQRTPTVEERLRSRFGATRAPSTSRSGSGRKPRRWYPLW